MLLTAYSVNTVIIAQKNALHVSLVDQKEAPSSRLNSTPPSFAAITKKYRGQKAENNQSAQTPAWPPKGLDLKTSYNRKTAKVA